jgi:tRNA A-37 threonylcarbamoyl transferase component Bud32
MPEIKDTKQATVHISYDGRVSKTYHGPMAQERFDNEVRVLRHLEAQGCDFVPKLLEADAEKLKIVTSNCGAVVQRLSDDKLAQLFAELESYGVRHEDPFVRNVTYSGKLGRFCLIDFELATILETGQGLTLAEIEAAKPRPQL